jgi:ribonuclease-3
LVEEGSERVKDLGRNKKLNEVAQASGLVKHVVKNPCQHGQVPQETAASTVEALVGAVYLDSGEDMEIVKKVLEAINLH